jgi:hypothetical protein
MWSNEMNIRKLFLQTALGTCVAAGALAAMAAPASAYVACNNGDCWHTENRVRVPGVTFSYHPDDWYFHQRWDRDNRHFRDYHEGRGYWRNGIWITL